MFVGKKIKEIREAQNMTLVELSQKSGVQVATLSRMENCKMQGTVDSHLHIANSLQVPLTDLYQAALREDEEKKIQAHAAALAANPKLSFQILSQSVSNRRLLPLLVQLQPKGHTDKEKGSIGSEKFIFVLSGEIEILIDGEPIRLPKNHSIHLDATKEHVIKNNGSILAKYISVMTPSTL
ncbi:MAG: cupin domain-containing protein [Candidatus Omnitrophica bacterium]|nr:cupin domain-containing protein [Candidatus Omnitrophota bacterium]